MWKVSPAAESRCRQARSDERNLMSVSVCMRVFIHHQIPLQTRTRHAQAIQ